MTVLPRGKHLIDFMASRPEFVGVGKATARRLWERFNTDLYAILGNGDIDRLAEVLDRNQAAIVIDAWRTQQATADCVVFFDEHGIDNRLARKAVNFWGDQAVRSILDNPYRLLTVCTWTQVDDVALRLGMSKDDPRRLVAAVEGVLYDRLDRKHTWCSRSKLVKLTAERLRVSPQAAGEAVEIAVRDGAAIPIDQGYQPAGAAYMERYIEDRIRRHIARTVTSDLFLDGIPTAQVDTFLQSLGSSVRLTDEQAAAVKMVMANTFSLLIGGAGVGKTTALRAINATARHFGMKVYQLAVAGRAASRMSALTGQPAQTIASWLRAAADEKIEVGRQTLIIIDEASMLDLPTLYRILFYLPDDAPLLLVGDTAQLPPIGFGLTLHRLVLENAVPKVELTRILRASEATGIPQVSVSIREGRPERLAEYATGSTGCSFLTADPHQMLDCLEDVMHDLANEEVQVVAATYGGVAGIDAINQHFHQRNQKRGQQSQFGFAVGDPCIWLANDYDRRLWNGSLGQVTGFDIQNVLVAFDGARHRIPVSELDRLGLAYCISVHKAQGSQFANVLVPLQKVANLDRAMLYTAVTRATDRVIMVGSQATYVATAKARSASMERDVALHLRLQSSDLETGQPCG
ncbi:exodeoxyribonuclease V alpha subunit [Neorhizobium galegae]|uniref:AAA family ATPase n=1 Tax=Neorhizobium galegae TaxID=399 RepID=UPI001AEB802F|nr:AAA family ATPase [Neorhizobium galegae]MBP2558729.1 exodeoxyribonuclease V alpha subunit [Neorhizobium galegae]